MRKKRLCGLFVICMLALTLVGCNKKEVNLDLNKIKTEIAALKEDKFSILFVTSEVESEEKEALFGEMEDLDVYGPTFQEKYQIDSANLEQYAIRVSTNPEKMESYYVLKIVEGKEEEVKKALNSFFEAKKKEVSEAEQKLIDNRKETTYEGYYICIVANNTEEVWNRMKNAKEPVFAMLADVDDSLFESTLGISKDQVEEYLMQTSMSITNANTYMIVKPKAEERDAVKAALDKYIGQLETQWSTYLPDQYELVKNRMVKEVGDYYIYIISTNNDKVMKVIENNKK